MAVFRSSKNSRWLWLVSEIARGPHVNFPLYVLDAAGILELCSIFTVKIVQGKAGQLMGFIYNYLIMGF